MTRTFTIGQRTAVVTIGSPHTHPSRTGKIVSEAGGTRMVARFLARNLTIVTISR